MLGLVKNCAPFSYNKQKNANFNLIHASLASQIPALLSTLKNQPKVVRFFIQILVIRMGEIVEGCPSEPPPCLGVQCACVGWNIPLIAPTCIAFIEPCSDSEDLCTACLNDAGCSNSNSLGRRKRSLSADVQVAQEALESQKAPEAPEAPEAQEAESRSQTPPETHTCVKTKNSGIKCYLGEYKRGNFGV